MSLGTSSVYYPINNAVEEGGSWGPRGGCSRKFEPKGLRASPASATNATVGATGK
jgi:hypothetical protein